MKKILFDTSVIIASLVEAHDDHDSSRPWIESIGKKTEGFICNHALCEIYSTLTVLPHKPPLGPQVSRQLIENAVLEKLTPIDLSTKDYRLAVERMASLQMKSGAIYDALHLQAALKKEIPFLLTLNEKDFTRISDPKEITILNPKTVKIF